MFSTFKLRIAQTLSIVMHPLIIPTVIYYLMASFRPDMISPFNQQNSGYLILFIFLSTFLLPLIMLLILYYLKVTSSLMLDTKQDRFKSMFAVSIIYVITVYMLYNHFSMNKDAVIILGCISTTMAIALLITVFWKISLHSTGIAGFTIFCGTIALTNNDIVTFQIFIEAIIISGFLLSSRLYLNKHNMEQVVAGYGLGVISGIFAAFLILNFNS
jgi:membrane-associated phospholipid phosphatase